MLRSSPSCARFALAACLVTALVSGWSWAATPDEQAETLHHRAAVSLTHNNVEGRRDAMQCLERATLLAPHRTDLQLELGRLYYRMGFLKLARQRFERVQTIDSTSAEAEQGLGEVWRRDYLKYLDRTSLARALEHYRVAARLAPQNAEPWLRMAPLQLELRDSVTALASAERSLAANPQSPEALLAVAQMSFRLGQVERADSAFRLAIPRLSKIARERFEDIAPVSSEADTAALRRLNAAGKAEFLRRFWLESDPDPVTPENEAQLEYWARVAQAYFLYFNPRRQEWDERGEFYVRYGPPQNAEYNPVGARLTFTFMTGPGYPMNALVWAYPGLGMSVTMEDRLLSEFYLPPITREPPVGREPDPDSLAAHDEWLATRGGRGVFPMLPPGVTRLPARGAIARFEAEGRPELLAFLESTGGPADSAWAEWVVLDSAAVEVARSRRGLDPSPCEPAERRIADFAAGLPAGRYTAAMSVRTARGQRGLYHAAVTLARPDSSLALSDLVVSCGAPAVEPATGGAPPAVRLQANPTAQIRGRDPLTVYFETYRLAPDRDGLSRFELEYTVRTAVRDTRIWFQRMLSPRADIPQVNAIRREEQVGTLRRQFVSIPVQALPPGRYRLEIRVRDLVASTQAIRTVEFEKPASNATGS